MKNTSIKMDRVLALSMRPKHFDDLVGQEPLIKSIQSQFKSNRIPHSFLICGKVGTGKTTLARIISNRIHELMKSEKVYDTQEINAANYTGIDDIRKIIDQMKFKPMPPSRAKVVILDESHQLSVAAQNALITETEDVPNHVFYIFCTSNPSKIIPALQRRAYIIKPRILNDADIKKIVYNSCQKASFNNKSNIDELIEGLISYEINSPGIILQVLERYISGMNVIESICPSNDNSNTFSVEIDILKVCRNVTQGNWTECTKVLKQCSKNDAIPLKCCIMGYLKSVLLNSSGKKAAAAAKAIQLFPANNELDDTNMLPKMLSCVCLCCAYFNNN